MKNEVAIIVGHRADEKGAVNYLGESEYKFNKRIGQRLIDLLLIRGIGSVMFYRDSGEPIALIGEDVAEYSPDISIELHFNSFYKRIKDNVTEVLVAEKPSVQTRDLAFIFRGEMAETFGFGSRGTKTVSKGERGFINFDSIHRANSSVTSILVEPLFANFETPEAVKFFANEDKYIQVLIDTITAWYEIHG